jgi:hypothetical protein
VWRLVLAFSVAATIAAEALADVRGHMTLTRAGDSKWRADYCLDEPVEILGFGRPIRDMRRTHWRAVGDALVFSHTGETATLRRRGGGTIRCASVLMDTYTAIPQKNYMAFSVFSDGGVSVYTGYFLTSVYKDGAWHDVTMTATYQPREGEQVIARDPSTVGYQFVYFGPGRVKQRPEATFVVDPAIPPAARDGVFTALPQAIAQLELLFGYSPAEPYLVFMAAGELETSATDHTKAGALPGQILFTMKGRGSARWALRQPLYFPAFATHEVVHVWQKTVWGDAFGADQPWVHEGAADALATELMRRAGAYSEEEYAKAWVDAENRCADHLADISVHDAAGEGVFDAVYRCGALVNHMVAQALSPGAPGDGLVRFWRAMAAWDKATINFIPSETLYFDTMRRLGFSAAAVEALEGFLADRPEDARAAIAGVRAALQAGRPKGTGY